MSRKTIFGMALALFLPLATCTPAVNSQFMEAVENGDSERIQALLQEGADVDTQNEEGWSAIIAMSVFGNTRTVQVLLDAGANVNRPDKLGRSALFWAVGGNHVGLQQILGLKDVQRDKVVTTLTDVLERSRRM